MKKLLLIILMCAMFTLSTVSAFNFDNTKSYNPPDRELIITNGFGLGSEIATLRLLSSNEELILRGRDRKVAEIEIINNNSEFPNPFGELELYNANNNRRIQRPYAYKSYVQIGERRVNDYSENCVNRRLGYNYRDCSRTLIGNHLEPIYDWVRMTNLSRLPEGRTVVGIFTDVYSNESVEWIPNLFGVRITEWAVWTESLNANITSYYKFDESAGNRNDSLGRFNATISGGTLFNATGVIKNATRSDGSNYLNFSNGTSYPHLNSPNISISFWYKVQLGDPSINYIIFGGSDAQTNLSFNQGDCPQVNSSGLRLVVENNCKTILPFGSNDSLFHHYVFTMNGNNGNISIYRNASLVANFNTTTWTSIGGTFNMFFQNAIQFMPNGQATIDEMGIWKRILSQTEITQLYNSGGGITYTNDFTPILEITLNSPVNGLSTTDTNILFNATTSIISGLANLTNSTIYVYNSTGSLFNKTTNPLTGNISNTTTWNISSFTVGNFIWGVYSCSLNYSGSTYCFSSANFSFTRNSFVVTNQIFNASVFETNREFFGLTLTTIPDILSTSAFLIYNGTSYVAETTCVSGVCTINRSIDIPLVNSTTSESENKTFYWNINVFDGTSVLSSNTSIQGQNVSRIHLELCGGAYVNQTLNFTAFDEQNQTRVRPFSFKATFDHWLSTGGGTVRRPSNFTLNADEVDLCITPSNRTQQTDAIIFYGDNNVSYNTRNYYFNNATLTNATQHVPLFLLKSVSSTSFVLRVQRSTLLPIEDALIFIQRYYPGENIFKTVQIAETDNNGESVGFFETETVDYKFIIVKNGTVLLSTAQQKVVCQELPCTITFTIGDSIGDPWTGFEGIPNLLSSLTFNQTTKFVTYSYVDTSGSIRYARLLVENTNPSNGTSTICNINSTLASATLVCNLNGMNGSFSAETYISRSPEVLDKVISFVIGIVNDVLKNYGIIFGWMVILTVSLMFIWNPTALIIAANISTIMVNILGLIDFGLVYIFGMIAVSIFILIEMRT